MMFEKDIQNINTLHSNFRSDVIAAVLADNGFDEDNILLLRNEGTAAETDKEILSVDLKRDYEGNSNDMLVIKTNRSGIYDNLPETLFHLGIGLKNYNKENVIETIRKQHKEEVLIRKFFSLYEAEIDRTRINISRTELEYDRPGKHRSLVEVFGRFWPVIKQMDSQTAILFTQTIPYITEIRNSYNKIAQAVSMITGYDISIKVCKRKIKIQTKPPRLGVMKLGINSVLKGETWEKSAMVEINLPQNRITDMLPQMPKRRIIEVLLETFIPADISYEIALCPEARAYTNKLGDKNKPCVLGVNARLM